ASSWAPLSRLADRSLEGPIGRAGLSLRGPLPRRRSSVCDLAVLPELLLGIVDLRTLHVFTSLVWNAISTSTPRTKARSAATRASPEFRRSALRSSCTWLSH